MIIPIGHDRGELRRWPAVTFVIIAVCYAILLIDDLSRKALRNDLEPLLAQAIGYYIQHPYLALDPRLEQIMWFGIARQSEGPREAIGKRLRGIYKVTEAERQQHQTDLDRLTADWRRAVAQRIDWTWGLVPSQVSPTALVTYMFVHAGLLHLLSNMLFLYITGPFIEDLWGRLPFASFYLIAGMVAAGLYSLQYPDLPVPLVGASGAVAGVMGAFLIRHPTAKIRFLHLFWIVRAGSFSARAWLMLPLWFLCELYWARTADAVAPGSGGAGVAYWAHVWGFGFGALVGVVVRSFKLEDRVFSEAIESRMQVTSPVLDRAQRFLGANREDDARRLLKDELARNPNNHDAALAYWDLWRQAGRGREALSVLVRLLGTDVRKGDDDLALQHWHELRLHAPDAMLDPIVEIQLAERLLKSGRDSEAAELVRSALGHVSNWTAADVWLRLARTAYSADRSLGSQVVDRALARPDLPFSTREELIQLQAVSRPFSL